MLHFVLQPRRHQHEDRVAVREDPDDPRPPPDFAVDALDPVVRPDLAPVLRREFRVGKRLGEPVAYRSRGRSAELRHAEIDFPDDRDEFSRVAAAVVAIPARRPLVALGPPTSSDASLSSSALSASSTVFLIRFYMSLRSNSPSTDNDIHRRGPRSPGVLGGTSSMLGEGLSILSACCANECAEELNGRGTFTSLLVDALNGGAADVMGHVTPGGVYAYIDKALGPWD